MKRYPLATARMGERQLTSVQPLPLQTQFLRKRGVATVERVPTAGVLDRRHVHANLVSPTGFKVYFEQGRMPERLHRLIVGHRVTTPIDNGHLPIMTVIAADRSVDSTCEGIRVALHQGEIDLVNGAVPKSRFNKV